MTGIRAGWSAWAGLVDWAAFPVEAAPCSTAAGACAGVRSEVPVVEPQPTRNTAGNTTRRARNRRKEARRRGDNAHRGAPGDVPSGSPVGRGQAVMSLLARMKGAASPSTISTFFRYYSPPKRKFLPAEVILFPEECASISASVRILFGKPCSFGVFSHLFQRHLVPVAYSLGKPLQVAICHSPAIDSHRGGAFGRN